MTKVLHTIIFFCLILSSYTFAQQMQKPSAHEIGQLPSWAQQMYSDNPNVNSVQNAYQDYYRTHTFEKNYHTQYYKRWIRRNQYFVNDAGFIVYPDQNTIQENDQQYLKKQELANKTTNWTVVGK